MAAGSKRGGPTGDFPFRDALGREPMLALLAHRIATVSGVILALVLLVGLAPIWLPLAHVVGSFMEKPGPPSRGSLLHLADALCLG